MIILFQIASDMRVKEVTQTGSTLTIKNIWEEQFNITFLDIKGHGIAAHAELC